MADVTISIEVVSGYSSDLASRTDSAQSLLEELAQIPRLAPRFVEGDPAPVGTKSVTDFIPVIAALASGVLPVTITTVKDWLTRQPKQTTIKIKTGDIEIEWSGMTPPEELQRGLAIIVARQTA